MCWHISENDTFGTTNMHPVIVLSRDSAHTDYIAIAHLAVPPSAPWTAGTQDESMDSTFNHVS